MEGVEQKYCDACINAVIGAWRGLMEVSGQEVLCTVPYGKGDTLGLDAIPEININGRLGAFDSRAFLITEELDEQARRRWPTDSDPERQPLMFFCDPTDRSSQLKKFFERISRDSMTEKIGNLMEGCDAIKLWEEMFEPPATITGSTSAITCVRKGEIVFSVILNYITATICVATSSGVFWYRLKRFSDSSNENIGLDKIKKGKKLCFPGVRKLGFSSDDCKQLVTFLGKEGYHENFRDSKLFVESADKFLHHTTPPGPPRSLYLSELQKGYGPVGFIFCNGEKIGEWIHWLSFVKYARNEYGRCALRAFEISLERPYVKNDMLMSTSPPYSLFREENNVMYLDMSQLRNFERPSQFRCMMVIIPWDNERIIQVLKQYQYREITSVF